MPVSRTFTVSKIVWNAITWDSESGGPLSITLAHTGTPVLSRTGADRYPRRASIQDRSAVVTVVLGEFKQTQSLAGLSNMVADLFYDEGAQTIQVTIATLRLYEIRSTQNRANPSEVAITFIHESAAGQASPVA